MGMYIIRRTVEIWNQSYSKLCYLRIFLNSLIIFPLLTGTWHRFWKGAESWQAKTKKVSKNRKSSTPSVCVCGWGGYRILIPSFNFHVNVDILIFHFNFYMFAKTWEAVIHENLRKMCLLREKDKPHSSTPNDAMVECLKWCYKCRQEAILSSSFYWYKRIFHL